MRKSRLLLIFLVISILLAFASILPRIAVALVIVDQHTTVGYNLTLGSYYIGRGQSFTLGASNYDIAKATFYIAKIGGPTQNVYVELYAESGGLPTGGVLATSEYIAATSISTSFSWVDFSFNATEQYTMVASTTYCIALRYNELSDSNTIRAQGDSGLGHSGQGSKLNGGWANENNADTAFKVYGVDATAPTYSSVSHSSTVVGEPCIFKSLWEDNADLSGFIFGNNRTGSWVNDTWTAFSSNPDWAETTKYLVVKAGVIIQYGWYANDTSDNWNATATYSLTTTITSPVTVDSYSSGIDYGEGMTASNSKHEQSFLSPDDYIITSCMFRGYVTGSPVAYLQAVLYAHNGTYGVNSTITGTPLAYSSWLDTTTISTGSEWRNFTFTGVDRYALEEATHYCIQLRYNSTTLIDGSNYFVIQSDNTNPFHDGNAVGTPTRDYLFYIYGELPIHVFHGLYDETTGLLTGAVDITIHYTDHAPATFEVNGTFATYFEATVEYVSFDLGSVTREYWISSDFSISDPLNIYIFNETLTTYTISFLDLAGVLDDYPFVEAQRRVNGTFHIVEKRKVDVENKIVMNLMNGVKYNLVIKDGSTYTFGDLLVTSTTSIQLTLKGIEFPKETLLTYKYVRIYGIRAWGASGTGNITITYEDTLELTTSVKIDVNYKNGSNAYTHTETSDSFSHVWSSALNNTDYAVVCTITHERYGSYEWKQYFARTFSTGPPWGLDFLGDSLPFATSIIIPMFLILFVAGCFSQINAEVGAFMSVVTALILTYMGWINIPAGYLITALCFAILMAIIYSKRRVHPY